MELPFKVPVVPGDHYASLAINHSFNGFFFNKTPLFKKLKDGSSVLTPNEYWLHHRTTLLNVLTGLFYVSWIPILLLVAIYLFIKNLPAFYPISLSFMLVNLLSLSSIIYIRQHGWLS